MYHWGSLCALYLHACQVSYCRRLRTLLYLCILSASFVVLVVGILSAS